MVCFSQLSAVKKDTIFGAVEHFWPSLFCDGFNKIEVTWKPWTDVDYLDFTACNEVCTKKGSKFGGPIVFKMAHCAYV